MTYTYWKTDELQHSGVKGMKWGIRKRISQMKKERSALRARKAKTAKTASYHAGKAADHLVGSLATGVLAAGMYSAAGLVSKASPTARNVLGALGLVSAGASIGFGLSAKSHERKHDIMTNTGAKKVVNND